MGKVTEQHACQRMARRMSKNRPSPRPFWPLVAEVCNKVQSLRVRLLQLRSNRRRRRRQEARSC